MDSKVCSKCKEEKGLGEFNKKTKAKDGLSFECKSCKSAIDKAYRDNPSNPDKKKAALRRQEKARLYQEKRETLLKTCNTCGETKSKEEFYKISSNIDGFHNSCKKCEVIRTREYVKSNQQRIINWRKDHYEKNKKRILARCKTYREQNHEIVVERKKKFYYANRENLLEKSKGWRVANTDRIKIQRRHYRLINTDIIKFRKKRYRETNREKVQNHKKEYYSKNKNKLLAYTKLQYKINKEKYSARQKRYYLSHREHLQELGRIWKRNNPERHAIIQQNHRAKKVGNGGTHTVKEWRDLKSKYDFTCLRCGKKEPQIKLTKDHVFPLKWGGSNNISNIQTLCHNCNCSKGKKYIDYRPDSKTYGEGWKRPSLWG